MPSRDWRSAAAYVDLEAASLRDLAWEYLRRNPRYLREWEEHGRHPGEGEDEANAEPWGLRFPSGPDARREGSPRHLGARCLHRHRCSLCLAIVLLASIVGCATQCEFAPPGR